MVGNDSITVGHTTQLNVVVYKSMPVLTFKMIDQAHARNGSAAKDIFYRNKNRFEQGKHYYMVPYAQAAALEPYGITVPPRGLTLITERGYLLLSKSLNDDLAWQVQEQLVDFYFRGQGDDAFNQVPTISATQLQAIRDAMINCTRYLKHRGANLSHTLYRQMKTEFGYQKIELLPLSLFDDVIAWIKRHEPICHDLYDVTCYVEREFVRRIKERDYDEMKQVPQGILEGFRPNALPH